MGFGVYSKANTAYHIEMYFKMCFNSLIDFFLIIWEFHMAHDESWLYPTLFFHSNSFEYCSTFPPPNYIIVDIPAPPSNPLSSLCPGSAAHVYMDVGQSTQIAASFKGSFLSLSYPYQPSPANSSLVRSGV